MATPNDVESPFENLPKGKFRGGSGPLPHPATHSEYAVGGRVGERAGTAKRVPTRFQTDSETTAPRRKGAGAIVALIIAAAVLALAVGVLDGVAIGGTMRSLVLPAIVVAAMLTAAGLAWAGLRDAGEAERRRLTVALGGAGATALLLLPLLTVFGVPGGGSVAMVAWGVSLGTGVTLFVLQRRRGR